MPARSRNSDHETAPPTEDHVRRDATGRDISMTRRIITGIVFAICNLLIARTIVSLFGLDTKALLLAQSVIQIPAERIHLLAWALSGIIGIVALILWLIFNLDERLSNNGQGNKK